MVLRRLPCLQRPLCRLWSLPGMIHLFRIYARLHLNLFDSVCPLLSREAPPPVLVASPPRRRSRQQPQDFVIRRSERLAKKSKHHATKPAIQAQNVLMRKLGFTSDSHPPDASSYQQFEEAFSSSLTVSYCEALDALLPAGMGALATGVATPVMVS
ncbi:hypothetical protein PVAP13_7KG021209 [Panicum virgatum]|uniref:Uncharacterized protein n=1 Tax=Panicum virgatum TaxID=38727 RepID=A0A8T0QB24_PANVG|nr:hypothetical protein PVAP13_7KG021209 [Panicum virgatum]